MHLRSQQKEKEKAAEKVDAYVDELDKIEDPFTQLKLKERKYTFLEIQEEYIKDEVKNLKRELLRAQGEVHNFHSR